MDGYPNVFSCFTLSVLCYACRYEWCPQRTNKSLLSMVPLALGMLSPVTHQALMDQTDKAEQPALFAEKPQSKAFGTAWFSLLNGVMRCSACPQLRSLCSNLSFSRDDLAGGERPFLKVLLDAEAAATAASVQLVSFKEALENEFSVCFWSVLLILFIYFLNLASMATHHSFVYFSSRNQGPPPVENKKFKGKGVFWWKSWTILGKLASLFGRY